MQLQIIWGLVGVIIGGGGAFIIDQTIDKRRNEENEPVEVVATHQQEIIKQLTDTDLIAEQCKPEGDPLLCREMFCRQMTRGIDSQTAGQECEQISNIANTRAIIDHCKDFEGDIQECYDLYFRRK